MGRFRLAAIVTGLLVSSSAMTSALASTLYVDDDGSDTANDCRIPASPCRTITRALGLAVFGDVVSVAAGTYDEANGEVFPLELRSGVQVIGAGAVDSVLAAPEGTSVVENIGTPLASSTRISGFEITQLPGLLNSSDGEFLLSFALEHSTMSLEIDNNLFRQGDVGPGGAIEVKGAETDPGGFDGWVHDNTFKSLGHGVVYEGSRAVPGDYFAPRIYDNDFQSCVLGIAYDLGGTGGTVAGEVSDNAFSDCGDAVYITLSVHRGLSFSCTPMITGNTFTATAGWDVSFQGSIDPHEGNTTFAPSLMRNTSIDSAGGAIGMWIGWSEIDGDVVVSPVISENTLAGMAQTAVNVAVLGVSVSEPDHLISVTPKIERNRITSGYRAVDVTIFGLSDGSVKVSAAIRGNEIIETRGAAIRVYGPQFGDVTGFENSWEISHNVISSVSDSPIDFFAPNQPGPLVPGGTQTIRIAGNTVFAAGRGVHLLVIEPKTAASNEVVVAGNSVRSGGGGFDIRMSTKSELSNLDVLIEDNVLSDNSNAGLQFDLRGVVGKQPLILCNEITGNHGGSGAISLAASGLPPDFGGGQSNSPGLNLLSGNLPFNVVNYTADEISAKSNWWGMTESSSIDGSIWDNEEQSGVGPVDFQPFLTAMPNVSISATLIDNLLFDNAPSGPSPGDILEYQGTVDSTGECGDAAVTFSAPLPSNAILVQGSITTSHGIVVSEDPVQVAVGHVSSNESVVITWQVEWIWGDQVVAQGTVHGARTGDSPSDDPDLPGASDPTVTTLGQGSGGDPIPTHSWWSMAWFILLLIIFGVQLLRVRVL